MAKIEPFEKYPERYDGWFDRNIFVYRSELEAVRQQLPNTECGIEIGVGTGRFAVPLGIKIGIEPSSEMRKVATKRGIKVINGVAEHLPFTNSTFSFALLTTTICFLDDIELAFREGYRILKPGGCLVIGFIDRNSLVGKLYQQHKKDDVFYKVATFYSTQEVISLLEKVGFKNFSFCQTVFRNLSEIKEVELVRPGYGKGSFVVIKAAK